ncbi:cytochrome-c peroxidase [Cerasicoccus arenae]|uniref:Cytochrome-c peroxidase n=1 Tax=Cerasicoccus arenae TaxID=424488 RepID=A0A8J3GER0_9BACT|nr:cytochrome c peroxidase [Cerasicoccus arenae]MBK1857588.1 hypothetical protein [Cerasicoccus arenae]GHC05736.1 hypothetical protein GCM10007047_23370 [Cerasicoccus arenae]
MHYRIFCRILAALIATTTLALAQDTLYAPMGVDASDGDYSTKVMVRWEPVAYATQYRIYRAMTNNIANAAELSVTNRPHYFDTSPTAGQTYYYWVGAENDVALSPLAGPDTGLRANGTTNFGTDTPLLPPPEPNGNALTASKAYLGKALFWEEQVSSTGTMACATCHAPTHGGTDQRSGADPTRATHPGPDGVFGTTDDVIGSPGVPLNTADGLYTWSDGYGYNEQVTGRYPRPAINAGYTDELFWDGRATSNFTDPLTSQTVLTSGAALESQAAGPLANDVEMSHIGSTWSDVIARIEAARPLALATDIPTALAAWIDDRDYPALFIEAYGDSDITVARVAMAIASYERLLFSDRTKYDRMLMGIENFTASETRGRNLFAGPRCQNCHDGPTFSDGDFHNIGVRPITGNEDMGRYDVTGRNADRGDFLTAGLRNVTLRGPFMHTGSIDTLRDVIDFYNRGGDFASTANELRPAGLNATGINDVISFLETLTDDRVADESPPFDHPTLYTNSSRIPVIADGGYPGLGNVIPQVVALEPPLVGNPSFTVGVIDGRPGAEAVFVLDITEPATSSIPPPSQVACYFPTTLIQSEEDGSGSGSVSVEIPDDPTLVGQTLYGRWYVLDDASATGIACSPTITITLFGEGGIDGKTGFAAWADMLLATLSPEDAEALANPDGDPLLNIEEYFANTDATQRNGSTLTMGSVSIDGIDYPTLSYTRRQFSADIKPIVEYSADLLTWISSNDMLEEISVVSNGDGTETITVRSLTSIQSNARQFLRLKLRLVE